MPLHLATTSEANAMLAEDPLALLLGMLLDQRLPVTVLACRRYTTRDGGLATAFGNPSRRLQLRKVR
ncbi:MAG: hypothetical protein ABJA87_03670 [bacterium]